MKIAAGLALVWLFAGARGLLSYLAGHPSSLGPQTLAALGGHAVDLLAAALGAAGAAALGRAALRRTGLAGESAWRGWLYGLVVGEATVALAFWALVACGAMTFTASVALLGVLAAAAWRERAALRALLPSAPRGAAALVAGGVVLFALARGAAAAGAPPVDWDTLANHFAVPELYLQHRAFFRMPWCLGANYPLDAEMWYAWLLALRGARAAQWFSWLHGAILAGAAGAWALELAGSAAAWPAAALVAAAPPFARVLGTGKNDLMLSTAAFAAMSAAAAARGKGARAWLLVGLLAGAAAATKLNGLWVVGAVGALASVEAARTRRWSPAATVGAGALLLGAWWYARNWWWAGNPFWPMLGGSPAYARLRASATVGLFKADGPLDAPFQLFVAALLACACGPRALKKMDAYAWSFGAAYAAFWFGVYQEGRLLLPLLPLLACAVAGAWAEARGWRRVLAGAALLLAVSPVARLSANNELFGFLAVSPERTSVDARRRYLLHALGAPYALTEAANSLPETARIVLYREPRGFYLERDWASAEPVMDGVANAADVRDDEELRARLKARGFTHVFYNPTLGPIAGDRAYYDRVDSLYKRMLERHGRIVAAAGPLALFALD